MITDVLEMCRWVAGALPLMKDHRPEYLLRLPAALDPREPYYRFLYEVSLKLEAPKCVEIGTREGTGAFHLAGNTEAQVLTIDIEPGCKDRVETLSRLFGVANVRAVTADSGHCDPASIVTDQIDVLFIDGDHTYEAAYGDYLRFRPFVVPGGLIVFDDTRLNEGMKGAWERIRDPKIEMPELHYMGFGVIRKDVSIDPLPR